MVIIFNDIFIKIFLFFSFDKQTLVLFDFYLQIGHSRQFEFILNIGLLHIVYHDQINKMTQISLSE